MKNKRFLALSILSFALACGGLSLHSFANTKDIKSNEENIFYSKIPAVKVDLAGYHDYSQNPTNTAIYAEQKNYHLNSLDLGTSWNDYRGDDVTIAVIDTGVNYSHEDFVYYNESGTSISNQSACFYDPQGLGAVTTYTVSHDGWSVIQDSHGHGTNVASTIASRINGLGGVGVAPNVNLMFLRCPNLYTTEIDAAIRYAADHGADIISMSISLYTEAFTSAWSGKTVAYYADADTCFQDAIDYAYNKGCLIFAAAGNDNTSTPSYPAANEHVIGVGALAQNSRSARAGFSNFNASTAKYDDDNNVDVTAVGYVYVASMDSNSSYTDTFGTSFSCPITAAAMALYLQKNPNATQEVATQALYGSCDDVGSSGWDTTFGYGCISISKLLGIEYAAEDIQLDTYNKSVYTNTNNHELTATLVPTYSTNKLIHWSTNNNLITLSSSTSNSGDPITFNVGATEGTTTITATSDDGGYTASCTVDIEDYVSSEFTITSDTDLSLYIGNTSQITFEWDYGTPSETEVLYYSEDENVATVSDNGLITAIGVGDTIIEMVSSDGYGEVAVTVSNEPAYEYKLVTDASSLTNGDKVIFVSENDSKAASSLYSTYLPSVDVTISNHTISTVPNNVEEFVLGKNGNNYSFTFEDGKLLYADSGTFYNTTGNSRYSTYTISISNGNVTMRANGSYYVYYNESADRFKPYTTSQQNFQLYKKEYIDPTKELTGISLSGMTTDYFVGQSFSFNGTCTATWHGDTIGTIQQAVTPTSVSSPDMSSAGEKQVTVTYTDAFGSAQDSYTINVQAVVVTSITLSGNYKTEFNVGDTFTFGGVVTANYNYGNPTDVTSQASFSGYNLTETGEQTVTVSYGGQSQTYTITVSDEPEPESGSTTGVIDFRNATSSPITAPTDHSTWSYTNCGTGSYMSLRSNGSITSSSILIDTTAQSGVGVNAHIGYYGGSQARFSIVAKNSNNATVSNTVTIQPTSNSDSLYTGTITFNSTDDNNIKFYITCTNGDATHYIRLYTLELTYTAGVLPPAVTSLSLDKDSFSFDLNGTHTGTLTPTVTFEEGADTTVTYTVADSTVASVSKVTATKDETITVTGLKVGTTKITATCGDQSAECTVSVVDSTPILCTSLTLDKSQAGLVHGASTTLTATVGPNNATNKNLLWSSSDSSVVLSSTSGNTVTITANGETGDSATISVRTTDGSNLEALCSVSIVDEVVQTGVALYYYNESVPFKSTYSVGDIIVKKVMSNGDEITVTPTSTNYTVDTGVLGNHQISASFGGFTGYGTVKVTNEGASDNVGVDTPESTTKVETTVTHSFDSSTDKSGTASGLSYSTSNSSGYESTRGLQWSKTTVSLTISGFSSSDSIKSITVHASGNCNYTLQCKISNVAFGTNQSISNGDSNVSKTFSGTASGGTIVISTSGNTSKSAYIKSFTVVYDKTTTVPGVTYPATPEQQAIAWATYFNDFTEQYCDVDGLDTNVSGLESIWEEVQNEYTYMTQDAKEALLSSENEEAETAVRVYKIIVFRYGLTDFIEDENGNSIVPSHMNNLLINKDNNAVVLLVVTLTTLSILSVGYMVMRKKKEY